MPAHIKLTRQAIQRYWRSEAFHKVRCAFTRVFSNGPSDMYAYSTFALTPQSRTLHFSEPNLSWTDQFDSML